METWIFMSFGIINTISLNILNNEIKWINILNIIIYSLSNLGISLADADKYNKIVQSSLSAHTQRLDELIYALFKMNELIQCKMDRMQLGLNGTIKSIPQLNFEQVNFKPF